MDRPTLSFIIPVFNEEQVIPELDKRLREFLNPIEDSWEIIFVNDGSKDRTFEMLVELCKTEPRYKVVSFARNFGHQVAITAGMDRAEGDAVVIMDADLQDPPEVVRAMLEKWREGWDVVIGQRLKRHGESLFKRATAAGFYRLLRALVPIDIPLDAGDFRLMSRPVILAMRALREQHRFVRGLVSWVGFKQTAVQYDRPERFAGETKYPLSKMLRFAIDGITSFSVVPLRLATLLGVVAGAIAIATSIWALFEGMYGKTVSGWATIMITVSLASSAQLLMTGILGEYVGRIYEEIKRRPLYLVAETLNLPDSKDRQKSPLPSSEKSTEAAGIIG